MTIQGSQRIVPVTDRVVRRVQTTVLANGKSVVATSTPDLIVESLDVSPSALSGVPLTMYATILNQTTSPVAGGYSNTFSYRWGTEGEWRDLPTIVKTQGLGAGETQQDKITFTPPTTGSLWIRHCTDTRSEVVEFSEENNCSIHPVPITVSTLDYTPGN